MIPAAFPPWARAETLGASVPEFALFQQRQCAQLRILGRDRPRIAGTADTDAVLGAVVAPCMERGALAMAARSLEPKTKISRDGEVIGFGGVRRAVRKEER